MDRTDLDDALTRVALDEPSEQDLQTLLLAELEQEIQNYHGRRKLTIPMAREFFKLVAEGHPFETICDFLGISSGSFWNWMRRGIAFVEDGHEEDSEKIFAYFYLGCKRAFATYRMQIVKGMHSDSPWWIRNMEILARRDRRNFSKNDLQGGDNSEFDPDERFV